jgi:hypothetical protein
MFGLGKIGGACVAVYSIVGAGYYHFIYTNILQIHNYNNSDNKKVALYHAMTWPKVHSVMSDPRAANRIRYNFEKTNTKINNMEQRVKSFFGFSK